MDSISNTIIRPCAVNIPENANDQLLELNPADDALLAILQGYL
jgi:hypothetical protein